MTFEKDFPSLWKQPDYFIEKKTDLFGFDEKQITKHCLDKQKVREAIEQIMELDYYRSKDALNILKARLNL
jgi:hypothetical protein